LHPKPSLILESSLVKGSLPFDELRVGIKTKSLCLTLRHTPRYIWRTD
jgi:hypothetical protein